jgi:hypothetical protein
VRSDLSRFHGVRDMESLPADRFFSLAERLQFYDGAVRWYALHPPEPEYATDEDALIAYTAQAPAFSGQFVPGAYTQV